MNEFGAVSHAALLLAAHGERHPNARNEGALRLARALSERGLVSELAIGFISGLPSIGDALDTLAARRVIVYPLFVSSGYFTRDRLVQLLDAANSQGREIQVLPPLGLDPGLPHLVAAFARRCLRQHGFAPQACTIILLAHGSRRNAASRGATQQLARELERRAEFGGIRIAFLEERPSLDEAAASVSGPAIVVGLFSGEGLHGARDAPRLTAELGRADIVFAGVVGGASGIEDIVARSVMAALLPFVKVPKFLTPPLEQSFFRS